MKLFTLMLLLTYTIFANQPTKPTVKEEGIGYIKMLGKALKMQLKTHLMADKSGVEALTFCTSEASNITKKVNSKLPSYAKVRRTALNVRNANNAPDAIDIKIMQDFMDKPTKIKVYQDGNITRVYKPLYTMGVCLKCHGTAISKELQATINKNYPEDKATNFKAGSLRGVIVSEIVR